MRRLLLKLFVWILWRQFRQGLRLVLGQKSLADSRKEEMSLEGLIHLENDIDEGHAITWENTSKSARKDIARYMTLHEINAIGEMILFFKHFKYPKISNVMQKEKVI